MENWYKTSQSNIIDNIDTSDWKNWKDPWVKVESSFIDSIAYFPSCRVLEVKLKDGRRLPFFSIPQDVYESFLAAPSKGNFFNTIIRKNYTAS